MKDPTRIPPVLRALERVWEGQPSLHLAELWGIIANHGVSWASTDEDLLGVLDSISARHPVRVEDPAGMLVTVETSNPSNRITIDGRDRRVTLRGAAPEVRPATWAFERIVRLQAGVPAIIADSSSIDHRLGVVTRITVRPRPETTQLQNLKRVELGDNTFGVVLRNEDGDAGELVIIGHGIDHFQTRQRHVEYTRHRFERLLDVKPGSELRFVPANSAAPISLGIVEKLFPLEVDPENEL